jgi:hypothetical protein
MREFKDSITGRQRTETDEPARVADEAHAQA